MNPTETLKVTTPSATQIVMTRTFDAPRQLVLRQDIAKGLSDAKNGRTKEIDFTSLKQQGRQILKDRKAA